MCMDMNSDVAIQLHSLLPARLQDSATSASIGSAIGKTGCGRAMG